MSTDRRDLFRSIAEAAREVPVPRPTWPLPPGALEPAEFRASCTLCGDCITACPHDAIGSLPLSDSPWSGRPALNPSVAPCHLCEDMPCIAACDTGALAPIAPEHVFFGLARIVATKCIVSMGPECGACLPVCPTKAITLDAGMPIIDADTCMGCGLCRLACPVWEKAIEIDLA